MPRPDGWMDLLKAVISAGRTIRSEHDLDKKAEVPLRVRSASPEVLAFLREHADAVRLLVRTKGEPQFEAPGGAREAGTTVSVVASTRGLIEVLVPLKGLVTPEAESARIEREIKKIDKAARRPRQEARLARLRGARAQGRGRGSQGSARHAGRGQGLARNGEEAGGGTVGRLRSFRALRSPS